LLDGLRNLIRQYVSDTDAGNRCLNRSIRCVNVQPAPRALILRQIFLSSRKRPRRTCRKVRKCYASQSGEIIRRVRNSVGPEIGRTSANHTPDAPKPGRNHAAIRQFSDPNGGIYLLIGQVLRVGQITHDTEVPAGQTLAEQRLDETEIGEGTTITFIDAKWPDVSCETVDARGISSYLGLHPKAAGLVGWDVFDAVLSPGDVILMMVWKSKEDAHTFAKTAMLPPGGRLRHVRVVRDYGMLDRREAPQYFAAVERQLGA
jgi:hypothetical protein